MRVVHISKTDRGGAGGSAYRLHSELVRSGMSSCLYVLRKTTADDSVVAHHPVPGAHLRLKRFLLWLQVKKDLPSYGSRRKEGRMGYFTDDRSVAGLDLRLRLPRADIWNLHWVAEFLDYRSFFACRDGTVPMVWRLSDMNPFTGGCHYDEGCGRFSSGCGRCPHLESTTENDLSRRIFERKKNAFARLHTGQLHIVAQSRWLAGEVRKSLLLARFPLSVIPNGVDTAAFFPGNRAVSRDRLGIPAGNRVLLFVAASTKERRKGLDLLIAAIRQMSLSANVTVLVVGASPGDFRTEWDCRFLGPQKDDRALSLIYSAADVFVIPSRQDNLPNTVLEAMSCGIPVVGFNVGGIPDMVRPGLTGWLAEPESPTSLSATISRALSNADEREAYSRNARNVAEQEYSLALQVKRYSALYESIRASG